MNRRTRYWITSCIFLLTSSMALRAQINLALDASASADTFLIDHPASEAIDGDRTDGGGWIAPALDTLNSGQKNIALEAVATASTYHTGNGGRPPEDAIDGITGPWTGWEATATHDHIPQWLELTWPSARLVDSVVLYTNPQGDGDWTIRGYTVQYWDGSDYLDLDTVSGNTSEIVTSTFDQVRTAKIRIFCTESDISSAFYRISELQVYSDNNMDSHWLDLMWETDLTISKLVLYTSADPDKALRGFDIQTWNGTAYEKVASVGGNVDPVVTCGFESVSSSRLRILCTEPDLVNNWYRINEVEVFDDPLPTIDDSTWNHDLNTIRHFFDSPPNEFRIIDYNRGFQQGTLDQLRDYGFGGVQTHVSYQNYLQDEGMWNILVNDVDLAIQNDMEVWIHDERGYPTGAAGGLVVEGHPEFESRGIIRIGEKGSGAVDIDINLPADMVFFRASLAAVVDGEPDYENAREVTIEDHRIQTTGLSGPWQLSVFGIKILDEDTQAQSTPQFGASGHYPSLLSEGAMKRFIELTHQNYSDHIGNIGDRVELFYTNEANLMSTYWQYDGTQAEYPYLPWEEDLPNQFKALHGYDLLPRLDALFGGFSDQARMVRLHFFQTVGEVMARNFSGQISEWCHENGVKLSGHPLLEEYLICHVMYYGDFMKVVRNYDVPACDLPVARPDKSNWKSWMPKFLSSANYLENRQGLVAALIDPIIGYGRDDLSPDVPYLRRTYNMSFLCGVNQITSYIPYEEYQGEEKEEYRQLNDYLARICMMLRGAKNEAPIAMYYPIESIQANYIASPLPHNKIVNNYAYLQSTLDRMAVGMLENGLDFNYVSADAILNASVHGNIVQVGTQLYSSIVMPKVTVIPLDVLEKIQAIASAGIPVHWVDATPSLGTKGEEHAAVKQISGTLSSTFNPLPELLEIKDREFSLQVSSNAGKLSMSRFTRDDHRIYYIINDSENEITINAESEMSDTVQIFDPVNGGIREAALPLSENIGGYESLFLVEEISAEDNGPIQLDAGPDTIICESDLHEFQPGMLVSIEGGVPPYNYSWSCEYVDQEKTRSASWFLNDTSMAHPSFINGFDTLNLVLQLSDNYGNVASDSLLLVLSKFDTCAIACLESVYRGDSIQLDHCISGGTEPYTYNWDNAESLSNPQVPDPWAKPESDTEYTLTLTDARACIAVSTCTITVLPTGIHDKGGPLNEILLYPNPARSSVQVGVPDHLIGSTLILLDISGKVLEKRSIKRDLTKLGISQYPAGIYLIGIEGKATYRKLIID